MTAKRLVAILVVVCLLGAGLTATTAWGIDLGDILKVGGVLFLVNQYDDQIDSFITSALGEREAAAQGATKVAGLGVGPGQVVERFGQVHLALQLAPEGKGTAVFVASLPVAAHGPQDVAQDIVGLGQDHISPPLVEG